MTNKVDELRQRFVKEYMDISASYYFEGSNEEWALEDAKEWADEMVALITQEKTALLERVERLVPDPNDYDHPEDAQWVVNDIRQALQQIKEESK